MDTKFANIESRLLDYTLSSVAFLATCSAVSGQVVYTDLVPDLLIEDLDPSSLLYTTSSLDVDGDGQIDFTFEAKYRYWGSSYTGGTGHDLILKAETGNRILGTSFAPPIYSGDYIGSAAYFNTAKNQITLIHNNWDYSSCLVGTSSSRATGGAWGAPVYLGFEFQIAGNTHYGWVRFTINHGSSLSLDAFAYQATAGMPILAGQESHNMVATIADISNTGTAADFEVNFAAIGDETDISEYRLMLVPTASVGSFDLSAAQACTAYEAIVPSGQPYYSPALSPSLKDVNGSSILNDDDAYHAVVLAVGTTGTDILGMHSAPLYPTLYVETAVINNVKSVPKESITATMEDITVSFYVTDLMDIAEFRLVMVPVLGGLDLATASSLPTDRYLSIPVPSAPAVISVNLDGLDKDADGNDFLNNATYRPQILSVSSSGGAALNSLTSSSSYVTVWKNAPKVNFVTLIDEFDTGTQTDFKLRFKGYENATCISEYRAFVVPDGTNFYKNAALAKPASHYVSFPLPMTGFSGDEQYYETNLPDSLLDYNGNAILHGIPYNLVVLGVGNGLVNHTFRSSNSPSTLSINLDPVGSISIDNSLVNGDLSDISVSFEKAFDESNIGSYRIQYLPDDLTTDVSTILAAAPDQYLEVPADGTPLYTAVLPASMRDVFGNAMAFNQAYKMVVTSVCNISPTIMEVKYGGSFKIYDLLDPMDAVVVNDMGNAGNGADVEISFTVPDESLVDEYRLYAVRQDLAWGDEFDFFEALSVTYNCFIFGPTGAAPGATHTISLMSTDRSTSGDYIGNGIPYKFYLLSTGPSHSLSLPTEEVMLADPDMESNPIRIETTAGLQQYFYFEPAVKHDEVNRYVVYLRKADSPLEIYPWKLANLPAASRIFPTEISSDEWQANLQSKSKDIDGNDLVPGDSYEVVVLTEGSNSWVRSNGFTVVETGMYVDYRTAASTGISGADEATLNAILQGGTLVIDLPENLTNYDIEIFSAAGQLIYQAGNLTTARVPLPTDIPVGVYLLKLRAGEHQYVGRFVNH